MKYIYLAGIGNSGSEHWQRQWYDNTPNALWLEHDNWQEPDCQRWLSELVTALSAVSEPFVIIAHSLGCVLFTEWAAHNDSDYLVAAFLVALPDTLGVNFPPQAIGFQNRKSRLTGFASLVVASTNDPYGIVEQVRQFTLAMGSSLREVGACGHINGQSNLGYWPAGQALLVELLKSDAVSENIKYISPATVS